VRLFADRRVAWVAAAAVAGLVEGQVATYRPDFWRGMFVLGFIPGTLQGLVLWRSEPVAFARWLAATQLGAVCTFVFTIGAVLLMGSIAGLLERVVTGRDFSSGGAPSVLGYVLFFASIFIGGAGLGGLQVVAFPRRERRARWVFATMLGSVAVAPIAIPAVGLTSEPPFGAPTQLVGLIGGLLYGGVTAIALPARPSPRS
jgi:hypothetical protein